MVLTAKPFYFFHIKGKDKLCGWYQKGVCKEGRDGYRDSLLPYFLFLGGIFYIFR